MTTIRRKFAWGAPPTGKMQSTWARCVITVLRVVAFSRPRVAALFLALASVATPTTAGAQWSRVYDTFYFPASHNWAFRNTYPQADRLFNAFDYGHAILYETLWRNPNGSVQRLEGREYDYITRTLLVRPPRVPLEEMAIEPNYSRLAPEAKAMFEWAHILHRQAYDVLADPGIDDRERDDRMREILAYYRGRRDLRLSEKPKTMALMQEQPYSLAFRRGYPKFNGLIWAYHWLQVGLYEPLLVATEPSARRAGIVAAIARFQQMLVSAPDHTPYVMPMTAAVAPAFAARYPEFAIIFDNLHSLHDVISDVLANPSVPRDRKRAEILRAVSRYRDDTTEVMTVDGWKRMSAMMGIENQGGAAVGFLPALPTPTVARGAVMQHDANGNMVGGDHAAHQASPARPSADAHAGHAMPGAAQDPDTAAVLRTLNAFHAALVAGDSLAALDFLDDSVEIVEGGTRQTKVEYRSGHLRADMNFAKAVPRVRGPVHVRVQGDVAWVTSTSTATGSYNGRQVNSRGGELAVLQRRSGTWRIVAVHW
ncbi:MAG: nuclear transport factor 2 family protein [Cytophagaceae bacterium]|nr:nuclear transport factor 2 family protein [Gemmatimonadaceae bacterium]